ncbi:homocysteine S-methyltransferase [Streptomyces sp. SL13]|uniref:Homocysteine S-methyltransferase n=1 Tax=Streptantibioticus silvisoli TaxID=2705255 RepID=A0AA90HAS3_9ACTN|nr:homocysteine S-methyltransferase [Streptantibioticus silvisoli]MDI5974485.1 homocysteine S-methyltransferase [Streptantibioticus silvisoli]
MNGSAGGPVAFADAIAAGPVVLDGGLSNQLAAQGCDLTDELWSARVLAEEPEQVVAAHRAYLAAGARVLTTASYQATFEGFARRGVRRSRAAEVLRDSVALARRAVGERQGVWVAASVGPYGAMLADGSEYRGRYGLSVPELERFHRPRIEALAEAGPDVLALETVPDVVEAEALLRVVDGIGLPVWLSYSVAGGVTRAGQPLAKAFGLAADVPEVVAVGVNCCTPLDAGRAIPVARAATGKPVVVYPNSGEDWDPGQREWHGGSRFAPSAARQWYVDGARLIGGCCRVGPTGITALATALSQEP